MKNNISIHFETDKAPAKAIEALTAFIEGDMIKGQVTGSGHYIVPNEGE